MRPKQKKKKKKKIRKGVNIWQRKYLFFFKSNFKKGIWAQVNFRFGKDKVIVKKFQYYLKFRFCILQNRDAGRNCKGLQRAVS